MKKRRMLRHFGLLLFAVSMVAALPASAATPRLNMGYKWPNTPRAVYFRCDIPERSAVQAAMNTWNAVKDFSGKTMVSLQINGNADNPNMIRYKDLYDYPGSAGRSYPVYSNGVIYSEVINLNPYTGPATPRRVFTTTGANGTFDIQSIVTHELGHALGVAHCHEVGQSCFSATCSQNLMNPGYAGKRSLTKYDTSSYQVIYG